MKHLFKSLILLVIIGFSTPISGAFQFTLFDSMGQAVPALQTIFKADGYEGSWDLAALNEYAQKN